MRISDWHENVYRTSGKSFESGLKYTEWRLLRDEILARDNFTCLRCDEKFRYKKYLTVHHLIPRAENGSNDPSNLVTLCSACHDYVEINDLRTQADIIGSIETEMIEENPIEETDWHVWVYGGARNPLLDKH